MYAGSGLGDAVVVPEKYFNVQPSQPTSGYKHAFFYYETIALESVASELGIRIRNDCFGHS
jgi:hypothetical protein